MDFFFFPTFPATVVPFYACACFDTGSSPPNPSSLLFPSFQHFGSFLADVFSLASSLENVPELIRVHEPGRSSFFSPNGDCSPQKLLRVGPSVAHSFLGQLPVSVVSLYMK